MADRNNTVLGMNTGTAHNRLRKILLFSFAQRLGEDVCFRCHGKIETVKEFSIEHKQTWRDGGKELFWDVSNITFSHLSCNSAAAKRTLKKVGPPGTSWCSKCAAFKCVTLFYKKPNKRWNGLSGICKECEKVQTNSARRVRRSQGKTN